MNGQTRLLLFVETNSFSQLPLLPDSFGFLGGTGLPRLIRCKLPRLRCHGHSLLLSSYLYRINGRILLAAPADTLYRI